MKNMEKSNQRKVWWHEWVRAAKPRGHVAVNLPFASDKSIQLLLSPVNLKAAINSKKENTPFHEDTKTNSVEN